MYSLVTEERNDWKPGNTVKCSLAFVFAFFFWYTRELWLYVPLLWRCRIIYRMRKIRRMFFAYGGMLLFYFIGRLSKFTARIRFKLFSIIRHQNPWRKDTLSAEFLFWLTKNLFAVYEQWITRGALYVYICFAGQSLQYEILSLNIQWCIKEKTQEQRN